MVAVFIENSYVLLYTFPAISVLNTGMIKIWCVFTVNWQQLLEVPTLSQILHCWGFNLLRNGIIVFCVCWDKLFCMLIMNKCIDAKQTWFLQWLSLCDGMVLDAEVVHGAISDDKATVWISFHENWRFLQQAGTT